MEDKTKTLSKSTLSTLNRMIINSTYGSVGFDNYWIKIYNTFCRKEKIKRILNRIDKDE